MLALKASQLKPGHFVAIQDTEAWFSKPAVEALISGLKYANDYAEAVKGSKVIALAVVETETHGENAMHIVTTWGTIQCGADCPVYVDGTASDGQIADAYEEFFQINPADNATINCPDVYPLFVAVSKAQYEFEHEEREEPMPKSNWLDKTFAERAGRVMARFCKTPVYQISKFQAKVAA